MIPEKLDSKTIYTCEFFNLKLDKVKFQDGMIIDNYHVLEFKGDSVVVVIANSKNEICCINSPRYTTKLIELEVPAGSIESGETMFDASKRELLEETGYVVENLKHVYTFNPANAISNQNCYILTGNIVESLTPGAVNKNEVSSVEWLSKETLIEKLLENKFRDGFSVIAILLYLYLINEKKL